jgi:hypothetical protein
MDIININNFNVYNIISKKKNINIKISYIINIMNNNDVIDINKYPIYQLNDKINNNVIDINSYDSYQNNNMNNINNRSVKYDLYQNNRIWKQITPNIHIGY